MILPGQGEGSMKAESKSGDFSDLRSRNFIQGLFHCSKAGSIELQEARSTLI